MSANPRLMAFAAGVATAAVVCAGSPATASSGAVETATGMARATSSWTPGFCPTAAGVTVVVDFTDLGDGTVVRCVATSVSTGVQALQGAGLSPEGTAQYGLAFICRIAGRPAADEPLAVSGDAGYTEQCGQTPPDRAHWEYWTAPNGGSWTFSQTGAGSHHPIAGGFEGWSFSLNDSHHPPGTAPSRPIATPTSSLTPTPTPSASATRPSSGPKPRPQGHVGASSPSPQELSARPAATATPTTEPTAEPTTPSSAAVVSTSVQPAQTPTHRGGAGKEGSGPDHRRTTQATEPPVSAPTETSRSTTVSGALPARQSTAEPAGSAAATLIGFGLLALLAAGAGFTAWRRSHRA